MILLFKANAFDSNSSPAGFDGPESPGNHPAAQGSAANPAGAEGGL